MAFKGQDFSLVSAAPLLQTCPSPRRQQWAPTGPLGLSEGSRCPEDRNLSWEMGGGGHGSRGEAQSHPLDAMEWALGQCPEQGTQSGHSLLSGRPAWRRSLLPNLPAGLGEGPGSPPGTGGASRGCRGGQMTDQAQVSERPAEREGAGCSLGPDCRHAAGTRVLDGRGLGTGLRGLGTGQAGQEPPLGRTLRPVAPARAESPARLCPGRQQVKRQQPAGEVGGHCSRTHLLLGRPGGAPSACPLSPRCPPGQGRACVGAQCPRPRAPHTPRSLGPELRPALAT